MTHRVTAELVLWVRPPRLEPRRSLGKMGSGFRISWVKGLGYHGLRVWGIMG